MIEFGLKTFNPIHQIENKAGIEASKLRMNSHEWMEWMQNEFHEWSGVASIEWFPGMKQSAIKEMRIDWMGLDLQKERNAASGN